MKKSIYLVYTIFVITYLIFNLNNVMASPLRNTHRDSSLKLKIMLLVENDSLPIFESTDSLNIEYYQAYIKRNPSSPFVLKALDSIDRIKAKEILHETNPEKLFNFIISNPNNIMLKNIWMQLFYNSNISNKESINRFESLYSPIPSYIKEKLLYLKKTNSKVVVTYKRVPTKIGKYQNNISSDNGYFTFPYFKTNASLSNNINIVNNRLMKSFNYKEIDFIKATKLYQGSKETHLPILDTNYVYNDNCILSLVTSSIYFGFGNYIASEYKSYNINVYDDDTITLENSFNYKDMIVNTYDIYQKRYNLNNGIATTTTNSNNGYQIFITNDYSSEKTDYDDNIDISDKLKFYKCFHITSDSIFFFNSHVYDHVQYSGLNIDYVGFSIDELLPFIKSEGKLNLFLECRKYFEKKRFQNIPIYKMYEYQIKKDSIRNLFNESWQRYQNDYSRLVKNVELFSEKSYFENDVEYLTRIRNIESVLAFSKEYNKCNLYHQELNKIDTTDLLLESVEISLKPEDYNVNKGIWKLSFKENLILKTSKEIELEIPAQSAKKLYESLNKDIKVRGVYRFLFHKTPILKAVEFIRNNKAVYGFKTNYLSIDTSTYFQKNEKVIYKISPQHRFCVFRQDEEFNLRGFSDNIPYGHTLTLIEYEKGITNPINLIFKNIQVYSFDFDCLGEKICICTSNGIYSYDIENKKINKIGYSSQTSQDVLTCISHPFLPYNVILSLDNKKLNIQLLDFNSNNVIKKILVDDYEMDIYNSIEWQKDGTFNLLLKGEKDKVNVSINFDLVNGQYTINEN